MRITSITNSIGTQGGGISVALSGLTDGLSLANVRSTIVSYRGEFDDLSVFPRSTTIDSVVAKKIIGIHFERSATKKIENTKSDINHVHGLWVRLSCSNLKCFRKNNRPYIISPHGMLDSWAIKNSAWKKKIVGLWFEYEHLKRASCLHALCESEARSIRDFGLTNPISIIPNGIDLPVNSKSEITSPWANIPSLKNKNILLFIGRIHPKKGLPLLLQAFKALYEQKPVEVEKWAIVIAGWEEVGHEEDLKRLVFELGLSGSIHFQGSLFGETKDAALRNANAFILPSYSEGLPMSILEAWSYKLPVLMTPECNIPSGFENKAAIRIETNTDSVVRGLESLFSKNKDELKQIGMNGYDLVKRDFTWEKVARDMVDVYKWVLGEANAPDSVTKHGI